MERLATEADLHRVTVLNIEKGAPPNAANLVAIAHALGTSVGLLLGEDLSDAAALERALPGWSRLTPTQQARIRETVADLADARPLEVGEVSSRVPPEQIRATEEGRAFQARADRLRSVAEPPGGYQAGDTSGDSKKPAAPRRRGSGQAPPR